MLEGLGEAMAQTLAGLVVAVVALFAFAVLSLFHWHDQWQEADDARADLCTLAFSHAESRLDSLEVTVTYDYCEMPEDG